jgi:hypothetical protein
MWASWRVRTDVVAAHEPARARQAPALGGLLARHEHAAALAASALLVWLAQFRHAASFGLYEDDYFFVARAMGQDVSFILARLTVFWTLPQGRPFGFFLPDLLSFVGDKLGGLGAIYALGFCIVTLNTYLCYRLLRVRVPVAAAIVGATVFCLFPADTTKILLTHDFQLQPALTFALVASLLYAAGHTRVAYVVGAVAFLSYESGFLALFGLPLLLRRWDRTMPRELARHVLVLTSIVGITFIARFLVGEGRATESAGGLADILPKLAGSLVLGPARSLAATLYQPLRAVPGWDIETLVVALVTGALFGVGLWRLRHGATASVRDVLEVGAAGLLMLALGYGLAFTHYPPNAIVGRGTSVHLGATLGVAVLAAAVAWALLSRWPRVGTAVLGVYLALGVGYYVTIERDFMLSWQLQRSFWQQVAACCSDLQDGTVLIYELDTPIPTTFIFTNSWADPLVIDQTFRFPGTWATPPRLFSLTEWQARVVAAGDSLQWWVPGASWDEHWEVLPQENVILLRQRGGKLERVVGSVVSDGWTLRLKEAGQPVSWPPGPLYPLLLQ